MKIISTKDSRSDGGKVCMYGASGAGKTTLIQTAPNPFIISTESGLLALKDSDIPAVEISTAKELNEAYEFVEDSDYETICLDSLSDIAECILGELKEKYTDARQAYGKMQDIMGRSIRQFRRLKGKNVYMTCKEAKVDINGVTVLRPSMPGQTLTNDLPYFFDLVLRLDANREGERTIHTAMTFTQICKDRSGTLDSKEEPDLALIFNKIMGVTT